MSASTITIRPGQLARVSPDFHITRGLAETHTLTMLNASGTAYDVTGITGWVMQVAQDFLTRTPPLAESETILSDTNVLPVTLNANTTELRDFMEGKTLSPVFATLIGLDSGGIPIRSITFRIVVLNSNYNPEAEPTPVQASQFYTAAQVDVKFAAVGASIPAATTVARGTIQLASAAEAAAGLDTGKAIVPATLKTELDKIESTLNIPRDVADLTDDDGLLFDSDYDSLTNKPTIPPDLTGDLAAKEDAANKATDFTVIDDNKFPTVKAVKDFAQNETLTELTGADVNVAPWTQSKWSASGTCTLTASGWAESGHQVAYVLITLAAEAIPSISGTEAVEDGDALSAAGVYECYIKNVDGKKYFRVISFTEAAS